MAYESGFLRKLKNLAESYVQGRLPLPEFAQRVRQIINKKQEDAQELLTIYEPKDYRAAFPKAVEFGEQGLAEFEEGYRIWLDYIMLCEEHAVSGEGDAPDMEVLQEGIACFKRGTDCMNQARDKFLETSEEDPLLWIF